MNILVFGDSITRGAWDGEGGWAVRTSLHYDRRRIADIGRPQPLIYNLGVDGDTAVKVRQRLAPEVAARRWQGEPVMIVLAVGVNDALLYDGKQPWATEAAYEQTISGIIRAAQADGDLVLVVGLTPVDETRTAPVSWGAYYYRNDRIKAFDAVLRRTCLNLGVPWVDIYMPFKAALDDGKDLLIDGLHPNDVGHKLITGLVQPAIDSLQPGRAT
jgi:lysophospholipase L1-like esterase